MLARLITALVGLSLRAAPLVVALGVIAAVLLGVYTVQHVNVDTDTSRLISPEVPWRKTEAAFDSAFPQNVDLIAIVIDAYGAPGQAEDAAAKLADWARSKPELFKTVQRPDGGEFFQRNGLMFLSTKEVQGIADQLITSQPMIGQLAADPSLRGLFSAVDLALEGVKQGEINLGSLDPALGELNQTAASVLAGAPHHLSWESLFTGRAPLPQELRRFVLVQPVLDYNAMEPGGRARAAIYQAVQDFGLTPDRGGVRVRLTGPVPLADEEFATVTRGAGAATFASLVLVGAILFLALRSWRIILAILTTLLVGLIATAAFAFAAVGALNLISVAFAVLFIGLSVDFSIQFSVRYRDERHRLGGLDAAILGAASGIGRPLFLAAATTAVGFFAFVPTDYSGVSELGLIAGTSMVIAFLLNVTLLPAAIKLLHPPGEPEAVGFAWAAGADRFLARRHKLAMGIVLLLAAGAAAVLPHWRFDFDPLNLKDPTTESVSTLFDLMKDPSTTPYTIEILSPSLDAAQALGAKIETLPEVAQVVTAASFIPVDQDQKIAILSDAAMLLAPTLSPAQTLPPPSQAETVQVLEKTAADLLAAAAGDGNAPAAKLGHNLQRILAAGDSALPIFEESVVGGLGKRLDALRLSLQPQPVTIDTLPGELRGSWIAADGRARLEIFPKGDARDSKVLRAFVKAVSEAAPKDTDTTGTTGTPVTILESGKTVVGAFTKAGLIAVVAIILLLLVMLRRITDVTLVVLPLMLAGLFTGATAALLGIALNYANIITLPLLLGIGVAFDIYFVMRWRNGEEDPLQSSTARAVLFSALTTMTAFGSLAASPHPGTSEMGRLLTIALGYVLLCTLFILPPLQKFFRR